MKKLSHHKAIFFSVLVILIVCSDLSFAQFDTQYNFRHYQSADGVINNSAERVVQDGLGFLWFISGQISITRFDGYTFKVYKHDPKDSLLNLGYSLFGGLSVDKLGNLWITNIHGNGQNEFLYKYDRNTDGFIQYKPNLHGAIIQSVEFPKNSSLIWFGGRFGEGLMYYNFESNETGNYLNSIGEPSTDKRINSINSIHEQHDRLILSTHYGIWLFDKSNKTFSRPKCDPKDTALFYTSNMLNLVDTPKGELWITLDDKLIKTDSAFSFTQQFDFPKGLSYEARAVDHEGVFWFASANEGLYRYDPRDNTLINIRHEPDNPYSMISNHLRDVMVDKDGNVWVATEKGIDQLQKKSIRFYNSPITNNRKEGIGATGWLKVNKVDYAVVLGGSNHIWIGPATLDDSISFKPFDFGGQHSQHSDFIQGWKGKNYFWVATFGRGIIGLPINSKTGMIERSPVRNYDHNPNNPNTLSHSGALTVYEDMLENLWVGTLYGLNKINTSIPYGEQGSVKKYQHDPSDTNSLSYNTVWNIFPGGENTLLLSNEGGVDFFVNGKIERIFNAGERVRTAIKSLDGTIYVGTDRGLFYRTSKEVNHGFTKSDIVTESILSLAEDNLGRIWAAGYWGILCYDPKQDIAIKFNEQDGTIEPSHWGSQALTKSEDGLMILKGFYGISIFDPLTLKLNQSRVTPVFTGLKVNHKVPALKARSFKDDDFILNNDILTLDNLTLDYLHNNFSLEFSAMELTAPEKNMYRYKLEDYDENWIVTHWQNRSASYTNLNPGTYTLRVQASNHHGIWSDYERTLKVIVLPPPWRTWWAYTGYLLLIATLLVWARSNIVQRERLKVNLQVANVEREKEHFELEKAKEVDKIKTSFFTNISHEFRTPLTLIKGPVQDLLEKYSNEPKTQEKLKLIQRNSELLLKLINQLLDLAKLESGTMKIEKSKGDINSFINAIASSFHSFAAQKQVSLHIELPTIQYAALFDKDKLETILINLINNAIKFTPNGGSVTVIASLTHDPDVLKLTIKDTGIGIPEEHQSRIFERFHQVSEAHKEVGTGVGLTLVKEFVTLLGGKISVKSRPDAGAEFIVALPIEIANFGTQPVNLSETILETELPYVGHHVSSEPVGQIEHDSTKPHILVVEDNHDLRIFIIDCLGDEFSFLEAENGKIGLALAIREIPDMIISDVMMPEMDGITMTEKVKKDIRTSHIPLILLTAKSSEDNKLQGLQSGADDYLTKPFDKKELLFKVRNGVSRQIKLRERLRADLMSTAPQVEVLSADEKFLFKVKEAILNRLSEEELSVEFLADEISMSRSQLYRKISALTGLSVNELIRKLRLQRAAQLLQQKWGPVSQVAYEVGFSNLSYFSKVFKEEFGVLPSEFVGQQRS